MDSFGLCWVLILLPYGPQFSSQLRLALDHWKSGLNGMGLGLAISPEFWEFARLHSVLGLLQIRQRRSRRLKQLVRIDIDRDGDVFGEGEFVESFANEPA